MRNPWSSPEQQAEWETQQNERAALQALMAGHADPSPAPAPESYPAMEDDVKIPTGGPPSKIAVKATAAPGMPGGHTWSIKQTD